MGSSRWPRSTRTASWMARGRPKSIRASMAARAVRPWWITSSTSTTTLPRISGMSLVGRREAGLGGDLVHARQRVHQNRVLAHSGESGAVDSVHTLQCVVDLGVREALLLDAGYVDDVDVGQHRIQVLGLDPWHVVLVQVRLQVVAHGDLRRGDKPDLDVLELAEQVGEGADRAPVGEV